MSNQIKRAEQVSRLAYLASTIAEEADELNLPIAAYLAEMLREAFAEDLRRRRPQPTAAVEAAAGNA